jgi:hypothetical protein
MSPRRIALFVAVDLAVLLALLLVLTYYGMSHLALFMMGLIFLAITIIDLRSGLFSEMFSAFFGFSEPDEIGRIKWLPVIMSLVLISLSLPVLLEHGFINSGQRWAMQDGRFLRIALPAAIGGLVVMAIAVLTITSGLRKK